MGSALTLDVIPAPLVQMSLPAVQDLPLLLPEPEITCTELIVAPELAVTQVSPAPQATVAKAQAAPVLSPSQVRTFLDC